MRMAYLEMTENDIRKSIRNTKCRKYPTISQLKIDITMLNLGLSERYIFQFNNEKKMWKTIPPHNTMSSMITNFKRKLKTFGRPANNLIVLICRLDS